MPGSEPSGPGSTIPCQRLDRAAGAARPQRHSRPPPRPGQPTNPRKIFTPTPSFSHRSFYVQTRRKTFNLQPYLHAIQGLFPFFVLFYCCKIFPAINFGLTTSKLKTGPGENQNFLLSRKIILSQCHFSFVIS